MIALDTNVLLRYVLQDDAVQSPLATGLMESLTESEPGFVSLICLAELYWVLDHSYRNSKEQIASILETLLTTRVLFIQEEPLVRDAILTYLSSNADFDDCLISESARAYGCNSVVTFDKAAAKSGVMQLLG